jgi:S1-C subfamily serine protease
MKKFVALMCLAFFGSATCSGQHPTESPKYGKKAMVERLQKTTVALVLPDDEGGLHAYCSGVWVGPNTVLTAKHCIEDRPIVGYETLGDTHDKIPKLGVVVAVEEDNDLALLKVDPKTMPEHPVALLGEEVWTGEHVNIVGHTTGYWWTYIEGVVSSSELHEMVSKGRRPYAMQVSSPAWFGNSGGGAFDDEGKLIGISSWISVKAPNVSFFVHRSMIKDFLEKYR